MIAAYLLAALISVESGGNPMAIGDKGTAFGELQITQAVLTDVNNFAGTHYIVDDCYYPSTAEAIFEIYEERYATPARLGHAPTDEDFARIWNGGPNGYKKAGTLHFWKKVRKELAKERKF